MNNSQRVRYIDKISPRTIGFLGGLIGVVIYVLSLYGGFSKGYSMEFDGENAKIFLASSMITVFTPAIMAVLIKLESMSYRYVNKIEYVADLITLLMLAVSLVLLDVFLKDSIIACGSGLIKHCNTSFNAMMYWMYTLVYISYGIGSVLIIGFLILLYYMPPSKKKG